MPEFLDTSQWAGGAHEKLDAYLQAAIATQFAGYPQQFDARLSVGVGVVVRLAWTEAEQTPAQQASAAELHVFPWGRVSSSVYKADGASGLTGYLCADVPLSQLGLLAAFPLVKQIQLCALLRTHRPMSGRNNQGGASADAEKGALTDAVEVIAAIDHGCPFAHAAFRTPEGKSRVQAIWDQDANPDFPVAVGRKALGLGYGRQIDGVAIHQFLVGATTNGRLDEDRCYRLAQYTAVDSRMTHGSMTLGLLAASRLSPSLEDRDKRPAIPHQHALSDVAATAPILFVQLPRAIPLAPCRGAVERYVLDGLSYILQSVGPATRKVTVVVSYGTDMGPHDGTSFFEKAVDAWVEHAQSKRNICLHVVFASGNSFQQNRAACIFPTSETVKAGATARLEWWVPMGNETPSFSEIWLSDTSADVVLNIAPPGSAMAAQIQGIDPAMPGRYFWPTATNPHVVVVVKQVGAQKQVLVQVAPTVQGTAYTATSRSGRWRIDCVAQAKTTGRSPIYAYAAWGGRNIGFSQRIFPSRFFVPGHRGFNELITLLGPGTLLGSGCGDKAWVIGGYEKWGASHRSAYSAVGPARGGHRVGTEGLAISEEAPSLKGILCMGTRSGVVGRVRGTSLAAPQGARELAQKGRLYGWIPLLLPQPPQPAAEAPRDQDGGLRLHYPW